MRAVKFFRYIIISVIIFFIVISASGGFYSSASESSEDEAVQTGQSEETETGSTENTEAWNAESENINWAKIYLEYLASAGDEATLSPINYLYGFTVQSDSWYSFYLGRYLFEGLSLIYVNDDEIPELVLYMSVSAGFSLILTIDKDGNVDELQTYKPGFSYAEKENILNNCSGQMGYFWDIFYRINDDGKWELAAECYNGDPSGYGNPEDYIYTCDGVYITEEEYNELCESYINPDAEIHYYDLDFLRLDVMRALLTEIGTEPDYMAVGYKALSGIYAKAVIHCFYRDYPGFDIISYLLSESDGGQEYITIGDKVLLDIYNQARIHNFYLEQLTIERKKSSLSINNNEQDYPTAEGRILTSDYARKEIFSYGQLGAADLLDNGTRITE